MPRFPDLAQPLAQALKALQMYQASHPRSAEALANAKAALQLFMEGKPRLTLNVSNGRAFLDGKIQEDRGPHAEFIIKTLQDRHISGLVVDADFGDDDLLGTLQVLLTKPQRLEDEGGVERALEAKGVRRIRVSQTHYQEVGSGEYPGAGSVTGAYPLPGASGSFPMSGITQAMTQGEAGLAALRDLIGKLAAQPAALGWPAPGAGSGALALQPAALASIAGLAQEMGFTDAPAAAPRTADLRQLLNGLAPAEKLNFLAGLDSLPDHPAGLHDAIRAMVPELLASAITAMVQQGYSWAQIEPIVQRVLKPLEDRGAVAASLMAHLRTLGLAAEQGGLEALINRMDWDDTPLEAKVLRYLEGDHLLELGPDHRLALLRDLLDRRMDESFLRALEQLLTALDGSHAGARHGAAETLAGVCRWALEPRLPAEAEKLLRRRLPKPFVNESEPGIHRFILEALLEMILVWLEHGELAQGTQAVEGLRTRMEQEATRAGWKVQAMAALETGIRSPRGREAGVQALFRVDKEQLAEKVEPYLIYQGAPMAVRLVERLESEQDRVLRGRIMDGLRAMGELALPPLDASLKSEQWFLVRNALVLVSEIGTAAQLPKVLPLLRHTEPRVSRSAVRAVWRLGGAAAENPLLAALKDAEYGTQLEILFALGQIKGRATAPALLALASDRNQPERSRVKILDAMAGLATADQVAQLAELARRKGLFGAGAESLPIRAAAITALASITAPEAAQAVKRILEAEPKGSDRDALSHAAGV